MASQYITRGEETADFIAWKFYGSTANGQTEALLEANRGLAGLGPLLPAGLVITLPEIENPTAVEGISLWSE